MKLYKEDNEAIPGYQILPDGEAAPTGFTEVTDIVEFEKYGCGTTEANLVGWTDKLCFRNKIKTLIYTKMQVAVPEDVANQAKWDLLNAAEKSIAAHYFIVGTESFLMEVVNDARYWVVQAGDYRDWTQKVRATRSELCESVIFLRMQSLADAKLILADMNQIAKDTVLDIDDVTKKLNIKAPVKRMNQMYIEGLVDEANDGVVAIKDWIQSTVGTPFENNGFMNLSYPFQAGHTSQSVADEMVAILDGTF